MSRENVIRRIVKRDVHSQGLSAELVRREDPLLYAAASLHFGTWATALQYAGISVRRASSEHPFSADQVLRKLRALCCNGYNLSGARSQRRDRRLYEAARQHFGSWCRALRAAGINLDHVHSSKKPRKLDKQDIIEQLRKRHEAGLTMRRSETCLQNQALGNAAIRAFGDWRRALAAE